VEESDIMLIDNYNKVVGKKDTTYIVGDFAFKDHNKYLSRLNGKKILILGSHDRMPLEVVRNFTSVHQTLMLKLDNSFYWLAHNCHRVWERSHYGVPHLFGHSHGRLSTYNLSFDVGVDTQLANYFPLSMAQIDAEVERRREYMRSCGRIVEENGKELYRQDDVSWLDSKITEMEEREKDDKVTEAEH